MNSICFCCGVATFGTFFYWLCKLSYIVKHCRCHLSLSGTREGYIGQCMALGNLATFPTPHFTQIKGAWTRWYSYILSGKLWWGGEGRLISCTFKRCSYLFDVCNGALVSVKSATESSHPTTYKNNEAHPLFWKGEDACPKPNKPLWAQQPFWKKHEFLPRNITVWGKGGGLRARRNLKWEVD